MIERRLFLLLCLFLFFPRPGFAEFLGRNEWILSLDADGFYGFTDRSDVYFDVNVQDIRHAGFGGRIGIEGQFPYHFSVRLRAGYQRMIYSDIGIDQIEKNYFLAETLLSYYFYPPTLPNRWDPYLTVGPTMLLSKSGSQGYVTAGLGTRYFFSKDWSLRIETLAMTDFSGARPSLVLGFNRHF